MKKSAVTRVLLTGINGFLGQAIARELQTSGYEVWGLSRNPHSERTVFCDLSRKSSVLEALRRSPEFSAVIHGAAVTPRKTRDPKGFVLNGVMTENLTSALEIRNPFFILISSVSVYGEANRIWPVSTNVDLRPSTPYARSKLAAESALMNSNLKNFCIIRIAPVYSDTDRSNLRKRVFLPGTNIRLRLFPPPYHSFCHCDALTSRIVNLLEERHSGRFSLNVCDHKPFSQGQLLDLFTGPVIACPVFVFRFLYGLLRLAPGKFGYGLRCLLWKFFGTNVYH